MLLKLTMKEDFRCLLKGQSFEIHEGINVLVGDQGCGKSSLLSIIGENQWDKVDIVPPPFKLSTYAFDFEKDNPRMKNGQMSSPRIKDFDTFKAVLGAMWSSHGECNRNILKALKDLNPKQYFLILMDEPETGLSIRSVNLLVKLLKDLTKKKRSILMATHNERLIHCADHVYSMEHRKQMTAKEFIKTHGG